MWFTHPLHRFPLLSVSELFLDAVKFFRVLPGNWSNFHVGFGSNFPKGGIFISHRQKNPGGDKIFSPEYVEMIVPVVPHFKNELISNGTVWLDEVRLF